jgi:hypothetical protein
MLSTPVSLVLLLHCVGTFSSIVFYSQCKYPDRHTHMGGFLILFRHLVGLLWTSYKSRTTQHGKPRTNFHALSAIRTHDLSVQTIKAHASDHVTTGTGNFGIRSSSSSSYGSTAQFVPWPPPLGFRNNNFLQGWIVNPAPNHNLEDQVSVFMTPGDRVAQLYPQALGTHFNRLLRRAWVTVGLLFNPGHHMGLGIRQATIKG